MTQEQKKQLARSGLLGGPIRIHQAFEDYREGQEQYPEEQRQPSSTEWALTGFIAGALGVMGCYVLNQVFSQLEDSHER